MMLVTMNLGFSSWNSPDMHQLLPDLFFNDFNKAAFDPFLITEDENTFQLLTRYHVD